MNPDSDVARLVAAVPFDAGRPGLLSRADAERIIHAVLWLAAVPVDSTAAVYAATELAEALGRERISTLAAMLGPP